MNEANGFAALTVAECLLSIFFREELADLDFADLTPMQRRVVSDIVASDPAWTFNANLHHALRARGLPAMRERLRTFCAA